MNKLTISTMNDPNHYANEYNAIEDKPKKIRILDSTLREGEQEFLLRINKEFR